VNEAFRKQKAPGDAGAQPAQAEHAEAQYVRKEVRPEIGKALQQFGAVLGMKIIRQPHVENQQRHGDAEDAIAEGVETSF
jgi:hypothetical protein